MKGSITVEAVLVVSVVLLLLMWVMQTGIALYRQTVTVAELEWIDAKEAIAIFRKSFVIKEMVP